MLLTYDPKTSRKDIFGGPYEFRQWRDLYWFERNAINACHERACRGLPVRQYWTEDEKKTWLELAAIRAAAAKTCSRRKNQKPESMSHAGAKALGYVW